MILANNSKVQAKTTNERTSTKVKNKIKKNIFFSLFKQFTSSNFYYSCLTFWQLFLLFTKTAIAICCRHFSHFLIFWRSKRMNGNIFLSRVHFYFLFHIFFFFCISFSIHSHFFCQFHWFSIYLTGFYCCFVDHFTVTRAQTQPKMRKVPVRNDWLLLFSGEKFCAFSILSEEEEKVKGKKVANISWSIYFLDDIPLWNSNSIQWVKKWWMEIE